MGFLSKILAKLGIGGASAAPAPPPPATSASAAAPSASAPPQPVAMVDVVAQLEQHAAANPQKLNWRTSIVDLLKLLDIDSSFAARKELATELGCPAELMGDSAKMNMWLHKTVLARIAANGGNVPKELLDWAGVATIDQGITNMQINDIIAQMGGLQSMARELGVSYPLDDILRITGKAMR